MAIFSEERNATDKNIVKEIGDSILSIYFMTISPKHHTQSSPKLIGLDIQF